jgi:hypothetical protein
VTSVVKKPTTVVSWRVRLRYRAALLEQLASEMPWAHGPVTEEFSSREDGVVERKIIVHIAAR